MAKSSDLTFRIFGKDVTGSKALKGVGQTSDGIGKKLGGVGTAFAGIGTAAAIAGGVIAIDFGKQSVSAFMAAQDSQTKFEGSLKKNGLGAYTGQIDALAQALALKTKFDDDATKSGAAVLANFGLTGAELTRVIPLAQDYAAFTGKDLPTASTLLGKAFLGNTKALKELGIAYKPTGDKAKDMAAIMGLVNDKVGGFAEKQGKTAAGTAEILGNQFDEVKEQVGGYLVPALTKLGRWIIDEGIPAIQRFAEWFKVNLLPVIQDVGAWITDTFIPGVKSLAASFMENVWPAIKKVAAMFAENLKPAIDAVAALWTNTLQPAFVKAWPIIQKIVGIVALLVGGMILFASKVIGVVVPAIARMIEWVVKISDKGREVVTTIRDKFLGMVDFFKGLPAKIGSAVSGMWDGIKNSFRDAINWIIDKWNGLSFSLPGVDVPGIGQVGGFSLDTPNIPRLATGGIVTRPTLALIGEAGPEAVIPLSRAGGMGGPQIVVNLHGPVAGPGAGRWLLGEIEAAIKGGGARPNVLATR